MKRTASKVLPAQPRRRFPAMGRERGAAGVRDTPAARTRIPGAAFAFGCERLLRAPGRSAGIPRSRSPARGAAGYPGRGAPLPAGSAGYTTAPAGGSPAGPQARAYATAALLTQFHRGPKSRDPSLGLPSGLSGRPPQDPAQGAGGERECGPGALPDSGVSPGRAQGSAGRVAPERPAASPGRRKVISPPARRGPAPGRGSPYLG